MPGGLVWLCNMGNNTYWKVLPLIPRYVMHAMPYLRRIIHLSTVCNACVCMLTHTNINNANIY